MRQRIRELLNDNLIAKMAKIFVAIIVLYIILLVWKWKELPAQLPLFYSLPKSPEQLGTPAHLLLLPFFSLAFFTIDLVFASYFYPKERLASLLLVTIGTLSSLLLFITFIKIVLRIT